MPSVFEQIRKEMAGKLNSNNILKGPIQYWHRKLLKLSAPSIKEKGDREMSGQRSK